jgi:asparagine synthase (glutamine-hydrolysing)
MSAIFGIHYFDDHPVSLSALQRMAQVLAHRGPDGSGVWCSGAVGLGHRMLRTTPESLNEQLPLTDPAGEFSITADSRLDNREELIRELRLAGANLGAEADSEVILAAYRHWGEGCVARLLGDFSFAIWDERLRTLFCARDHFGVRPFYYYSAPGRIFAFATEIKALFTLPEVPCELYEVRVGDHLADVFADEESTFYCNILRLPAAHCMTVTPNGVRTRRYWSLEPSNELRLSSNEEYAERFRELFSEAVRSRLRSVSPVGSMLSGGLDSSSITCTARKLLGERGLRLLTFSTIFDNVPKCDEREYINAVLALDGFDPHFIQGDQSGPFREIDRIHWHEDQAFYAPNFSMVWRIYKTVREKGVKVLLDGHDGDSVVSHGYKYLDELAIAGRWFTLTREIGGLAKHYGDSPLNLLRAYAWHYGFEPFLSRHKSLRMARRIFREIARRRPRYDSSREPNGTDWQDLLNPDFAAQTNMAERRTAWRKTLVNSARSEREAHYRVLTQPLQSYALEVHDSAAAAFGLEKRYPFWDRRVVEFCLSLPGEQKLFNGWTRMVMRRAMENILPKKVQWRGGKMDFSASLSYGLKTFEQDLMARIIIDNPEAIEKYVNVNVLRKSYQRFLAGEAANSSDLFNIWKCTSLALWLQYAWSH